MAERETVAVLVIDETGAVRSVNALKNSLPALERQTRTTGDVFTERFLSMRHAAIAFLGGFTLAGVILQLRQFAAGVVESAGAFGEFKKKADELDFRLKEFLVHALDINGALQDMTVWMDRLIFLGNQMASAADSPLIKGVGVVNKFLFGLTGAGMTLKVLEKAGEIIDKARAGTAAQGPMQGPPVPSGFFPGAEAPSGLGNTPYTPGLLGQTYIAGLGMVDIAKRLPDALSAIEDASNPIKDTWTDMREQVEGIANAWGASEDNLVTVTDLVGDSNRQWTYWLGVVDELTASYEKFQTVAQAASEAINAAAISGAISQRNAARLQMAILAIQSILKGKIEVAEAAAAAARYDFGSAALHGVAAGLYFAAAGFESHAARVGPAGAVGSSGNFTVAGQVAAGPQRPAVTVIIEGNVVGNEEFIRDHIVPGIEKAFTDNANGGSF